jgi:hypothetical protein
MIISASPLVALIEVFAGCAAIVGVVTVVTAGLAIRHHRRLRNGVYSRVLAENPSSQVLKVLTVGDYIRDPSLRGEIQLRLPKETPISNEIGSKGSPRPAH